jgi:hypothetical protein
MNRLTSIALIVAGVILLVYGLNASDSVGSGVSRLFTGAPTDKAIWLVVGGGAALLVGLGGIFTGRRQP